MLHHKFKIERVEQFDPERCQATRKMFGQCILRAIPGSKYCPIHGGNRTHQENQKKILKSYRLARYQARLQELTDSSQIKSLREEIAILRFLVQTILDKCQDGFGNYQTIISRLISEIQSLAEVCLKVEQSLDSFLDKKDAITIAENLLLRVAVKTQVPDELYDDVMSLLDSLHTKFSSERTSNYRLNQWQEQIVEHLTDEKVISLRGEIGIVRLIVEDQLNSIHDPYDLVVHASKILESVRAIGKLVSTCHKLEASSGLMLSEDQAKAFAQELLTIIGNHIKDEEILIAISS